MLKTRLAIIGLALAIIFGLGLLAGVLLPRLVRPASQAPVALNTATILRQVQSLSQLVTVKYVLEKVVVLEDVKWYGENRVLIVAHGIVKAGVDLGRLQATDLKADPDGRRVVISLPPASITDVYLDDSQTQVIERTTGLLRVFDKNLEQLARRQAVDDLRRSARYSGILKDADERARDQVRGLLELLGFSEVEFRAP